MTDKISYALGILFAENLKNLGIGVVTPSDITAGITDGLDPNAEVQMTLADAQKLVQETVEFIQKEAEEKYVEDCEAYLKKTANDANFVKTSSGLMYKVITEGTGKTPGKNSDVKCHYEGKLITGDVFDSSYQREKPATFGLGQVIPGWTEALQLMKEGGKMEIVLSKDLGYGDQGVPGVIPPKSVLIFTVELLEVL